MIFRDYDIEQLNLSNVNDFSKLMLHYLCGKSYKPEDITEEKRIILRKIIDDLNSNYLNYEQFNEVLLLFNLDRISREFFNFLFLGGRINIEVLKKGIIEFRGLSILNFGNFKNTYKRFSKMKKEEIDKYYKKYYIFPKKLETNYKDRPDPIINLKLIEKEKTWYLGYISSKLVDIESKELENELNKCENPELYESFSNILINLYEEIKKTRGKGEHNTNAYLIWDYIDIYIATSMRKNCEFEETYEIINQIFNNPNLKRLKIRYFDPTQSHCALNRDKGLIEGLMLKRAKCTIYMIQESDTFGKDSELASTLAQKKPVIAFIPDYDVDDLYEKIKNYPLDFIKERLFNFKAEDTFEDDDFLDEIDKDIGDLEELINDFIENFRNYRESQQFSLWIEKENQFKSENLHFSEICKILAVSTKKYWNKRAKTLKDTHPLGMQIDLDSGVANGVIVVRDVEICVKILENILLNNLEFEIKHIEEDIEGKKYGYTGLFEHYSGSIYRIVTDNKLLTNSFWNFFYKI